MKQWTVTYREKSGVKTSVVIEAEDRAGVFAELKQRGINAISITEGVVKAKRSATSGGVSKGVWGVVAAVMVLAGGLVAIMLLSSKEKHPSVEVVKKSVDAKRVSRAEEFKPVLEVEEVQEKVQDTPKSSHKKGEIWYTADGKKMITLEKDGVLQDVEVYVRKHSNLAKTSIFRYPSENQIANLLRVEVGTGVFGNRDYKGFKANFLKSLEEEIEILDSDDEWTRALKQEVSETKRDLKKRLDAGEDIEEIMRSTRDELKKLAYIKRSIEQDARKMMMAANTEEDIEIVKEAANRLLEEKGIAPIKFNPIIERRILEINGGKNE